MGITADTNIFLRIILNDDPVRAAAVASFLAVPVTVRGEIEVWPSTLSEVVFVLGSDRYGFKRPAIVAALDAIVALPVKVLDAPVVRTAIKLYRDSHPDWDDCLVAATALHFNNGRLLSYDRQLSRIPGLTRIEPPVANAS